MGALGAKVGALVGVCVGAVGALQRQRTYTLARNSFEGPLGLCPCFCGGERYLVGVLVGAGVGAVVGAVDRTNVSVQLDRVSLGRGKGSRPS